MKMTMMIMSMIMPNTMIMVITMIMAMTIMKNLLQCKWWLQFQLMDDDSDANNGSDISHGNNDDGWRWL